MSWQRWLKGIRLTLGFLLAPAVVSICVSTSADRELARIGAHPSGPAGIMLACCVGGLMVLPYVGTLCLCFPYVLIQMARGRLGFWAVMLPTLVFSLVYAAEVYSSFCDFHPPHPVAENVAVRQIPAVLLSGLCFYFVAVWKSGLGRSQFFPQANGSPGTSQTPTVCPQ
jgi:hypothetical protein